MSERPAEAAFPLGGREFVVLMAAIQALQALAIDAMLPALGDMSHALGAGVSNQRQLVIGVFLICSGLASLFPGAIADALGRRRVLFFCLGAYVLMNLGAAFAQDFTTLLVFRALTGLGSSGLIVLTAAIIRDRYSGDRMARLQSL